MENESNIVQTPSMPKWNKSSKDLCKAETSYYVTNDKESKINLPFQRATVHRSSKLRFKVRKSSGESSNFTAAETNSNSSIASDLIQQQNGESSKLNIELNSNEMYKNNKQSCDSVLSAHKYLFNELPEKVLKQHKEICIPFHHTEESEFDSKVNDVIVLGVGTEGPSANATIHKREKILDERHAAQNEIRFIHEHTKTYRLETVLHFDDESLFKWAERIINKNNEKKNSDTTQKINFQQLKPLTYEKNSSNDESSAYFTSKNKHYNLSDQNCYDYNNQQHDQNTAYMNKKKPEIDYQQIPSPSTSINEFKTKNKNETVETILTQQSFEVSPTASPSTFLSHSFNCSKILPETQSETLNCFDDSNKKHTSGSGFIYLYISKNIIVKTTHIKTFLKKNICIIKLMLTINIT